MTAPDLLPCPFCGCAAVQIKNGYGDAGKSYWVECLQCRSAGSEGKNLQAVAAWNTRYKPKAEELFDQQIAEYVKRGKP